MVVKLASGFGLFGTRNRTNLLVLISLLEETHASELARLLGIRLYTVQNAIDSLEQAGVVSGAVEGRERRVRLNPRFFARDELKVLLDKMAAADRSLMEKVSELRRRPRRSGKPL